jgi:hypothetical protein
MTDYYTYARVKVILVEWYVVNVRVKISGLMIANRSNEWDGITRRCHHRLRDELEPRVNTRVTSQIRVIVRQVTAKGSKVGLE